MVNVEHTGKTLRTKTAKKQISVIIKFVDSALTKIFKILHNKKL